MKTKHEMIAYYNDQIAICYNAKNKATKPEVFWARIRMYEDEIRYINQYKERQMRLII